MEIRYYKKDAETCSYPYENGKILATIKINNSWVANPFEEDFLAMGWEQYTPTPTPYVPTRSELIHQEIRSKYTENDEFMILRKYTADPLNEDNRLAFEEYNTFVEEVLAKYPEE